MMENLSQNLNSRLDCIENRVQGIQNKTKDLEDKIDTILAHLATNSPESMLNKDHSAVQSVVPIEKLHAKSIA